MYDHWDLATLKARVDPRSVRSRYPGASPDPSEINAYERALPSGAGRERAVVLGMTPELRRMTLERFDQVVSVDVSAEAVALFSDWVDPRHKQRERIVERSWFDLDALIKGTSKPSAVLGDGVFGNLNNADEYQQLLNIIASVLPHAGRFITRQALCISDSMYGDHDSATLLARYRRGEIDSAEFGFGMRMTGFLDRFFDRSCYILDNARIFEHCADMHRAGRLTAEEYAAICRYYYGGTNCLLPEREWERVLREAGFEFRIHRLSGKLWYAYYPIYECWKTEPAA